MDDKRRPKRAKRMEETGWNCSVCTFKNSPEAFKCDMCDVRKGTSTRKPRLNTQIISQQVAQTQFAQPPAKKEKKDHPGRKGHPGASTSGLGSGKKSNRPPRLKNIDRSSAQTMEVTVNNVTVLITDYKPKRKSEATSTNTNQDNHNTSSSKNSSTNSSPSKDHPNDNKSSETRVHNASGCVVKCDSLTNGDASPKEESS